MIEVLGVRFKKSGKIYYFSPNNLEIALNQYVIVETVRGMEFGQCVIAPKKVSENEIIMPLKNVLRTATEEDIEKHNVNKEKEKDAFDLCLKKIEEHDLPMKLIDVEYTFDNNKVIFYFTAEGRVDFRELVKDLASIFRTRIELRQIGVRDEAKMIGGLGPCGRPMCCSSFLGDFAPVSIKMAKEQNLSLNPSKISGICGRLMCCLNYEQITYEEIKKEMPRINSLVSTELGKGIVVANSVVKETVNVKLKQKDGEEIIKPFHMSKVKLIKGDYEYNAMEERSQNNVISKQESKELKEILKED